MPAIRPTAVAGSFYSADAAELRAEIDDLLGSTVSAAIAPIPKALIAPHAGYIYSGPITAAGYRRLAYPAVCEGGIDPVQEDQAGHRELT